VGYQMLLFLNTREIKVVLHVEDKVWYVYK